MAQEMLDKLSIAKSERVGTGENNPRGKMPAKKIEKLEMLNGSHPSYGMESLPSDNMNNLMCN